MWKSFAMNVKQRKDALRFFIGIRRNFIVKTNRADRFRLDWTVGHFADMAASLDPNVGTDRLINDS
jgi:CelD/BcsL family acetyltransferase involved in cellulose biosynthesis